MASRTARSDACVVHRPAEKRGSIFMAILTRLRSREVVRRFAHHAKGLAIVASQATSSDPHVLITLYQKVGRADMASVAGSVRRYVIDGFGLGADPGTDGVASRTIFGSVLEDTVDVALFALQRQVHVSQYESGFGVVEIRRGLCSLDKWREANRQYCKHCQCYFNNPAVCY